MRSLTTKYRLVGFTLPEVLRALSGSCNDFQYQLKLNGRKLKEGPMLSAIVLAFTALPHDQQRKFLVDGIGRLESLMAQDDPFDMQASPSPAVTIVHEAVKSSKSSGSKPSSRKKAP